MKDLKKRISKARGTFARLKKTFRSSNISRKTKLKLFKTLVVPVVLYGCETWFFEFILIVLVFSTMILNPTLVASTFSFLVLSCICCLVADSSAISSAKIVWKKAFLVFSSLSFAVSYLTLMLFSPSVRFLASIRLSYIRGNDHFQYQPT